MGCSMSMPAVAVASPRTSTSTALSFRGGRERRLLAAGGGAGSTLRAGAYTRPLFSST